MLSTEGFISLPSYFDLYICSLLLLHGPPGATNIVFISVRSGKTGVRRQLGRLSTYGELA